MRVFNEVTLSERGAVTDLFKLKPSHSLTNKRRKREGFLLPELSFWVVFLPFNFLNEFFSLM